MATDVQIVPKKSERSGWRAKAGSLTQLRLSVTRAPFIGQPWNTPHLRLITLKGLLYLQDQACALITRKTFMRLAQLFRAPVKESCVKDICYGDRKYSEAAR